jgi:hypothetical protein
MKRREFFYFGKQAIGVFGDRPKAMFILPNNKILKSLLFFKQQIIFFFVAIVEPQKAFLSSFFFVAALQ